MYNITNKSNTFYVYNNYTKKHSLIGNKDDFINFLAKEVNTYGYEDTSRWNLSILSEQNVTMEDCYTINDGSLYYPKFNKYLRQYTFYDGNFSIVNIRDYLDEIYSYIKENKVHNKKYNFKKYQYKSRKYHCGSSWHNKMPKTYRTKRLNSDPDIKEFVKRKDKEFPICWDDTYRRISCCWKDQYKCKKQWGHKNKHNDKNTKSIRNYFQEEIDGLLFEENF